MKKHYAFLLLMFWCVPIVSLGQVTVTSNSNATQLAQSLVGPGVVVSNATLTGSTTYHSSGTFTAINSNIGLPAGVVLSTGDINGIPSASATGVSNQNCGTCGDSDLLALAKIVNQGTQFMKDAIILEFDVFVTADSIQFNYIFGSSEYPIWVCTQYNDVFGFFLSGPGISGPYSNNAINIALIPGTNTPVAINTINGGGTACPSNSQYFVNNTATTNSIKFNGFSNVLTAKAKVQPCQTYHLKLAIADGTDQSLDSGVFIEAGSLKSYGYELSATTDIGAGYPYAVEGCNKAIFSFTTALVDTFDKYLHFGIGGSATNGTDYTFFPDSILMPANKDSVAITLDPIQDGITEGVEEVKFYVKDPCYGNIVDSVVIAIKDSIGVQVTPSSAHFCEGDSIELNASGAYTYKWFPSSTVSNDTLATVSVAPLSSTIYTVEGSVGNCVEVRQVPVLVNTAPPANAGPDLDMCYQKSVQINAMGGDVYKWTPPMGLSDANIPNPIANPFFTTTYTLSVTDSVGCKNTDTMTLFVRPNPTAMVNTPDTTICPDEQLQLSASGGDTYAWSPAADFDNDSISNPVATVGNSVTYTVTAITQYGCTDEDSVTITLHTPADPNAAPDTAVCPGEVVTLRASNGVDYQWEPSAGLSGANTANPEFTVNSTTTFTVSIVDNNGCENTDNVTINLNPLPNADAGLPQIIYIGEIAQLQGSGGGQYSWVPGESLDNPSSSSPNATPIITTTYTVEVVSVDGCVATDTVSVTVRSETNIFIPNAFSPNKDGTNDEFRVTLQDVYKDFNLRIYNRWGQQVFATNDIDEGWDGAYNGTDQPMGTYIYIIEAVNAYNEAITKKGNITLVR